MSTPGAPAPAPPGGPNADTHLAHPVTPLLGREQELSALAGLLADPTVRVVTLTGPGGIGKTRLALAVAAGLKDGFAGGVCSVSLASVRDAALVLPAIRHALALPESMDAPLLDQLIAHLGERSLLLVLDNCEHLPGAADELAVLIAGTINLKLLATSRALLRLYGEHEVAVPPLPMPRPGTVVTAAELARYPAAQLFVARARAARPAFELTDANAPAVAEITRRLDGLPLAIELAAALLKLFSPQALLDRMGKRLPLLTGGARDLPARHHTLRNALGWSYELLDQPEQQLFRRLAVFAGGWTFDAAESVCNAGDDLALPVFDGLVALLEKSLVLQEGLAVEPRFSMLETIREFALEQLAAAGEEPRLREWHASHFLALAEQAEGELRGPQQTQWLDRLEQEHDNLRAALAWELEGHRLPERALRLAGALWRFWDTRGYLQEGRRWLALALARRDGAPIAAQAKALNAAGLLAWSQSDFPRARALLGASLALSRALGDRFGIARTLNNLGSISQWEGDLAAARAAFLESAALFRQLGLKPYLASVLTNLGVLAWSQASYGEARSLYGEALATRREMGDKQGIAALLHNLGAVASEQGDHAAAEPLYHESLALSRELRDAYVAGKTLKNLGDVAMARHDYAAAGPLYDESLSLRLDLEDWQGIAAALDGIAELSAARGDALQAARLWSAAEQLRQSVGITMAPVELAGYERIVSRVRPRADGAAWEAAWAEGRALPLQGVLELARHAVAVPAQPVPQVTTPAASAPAAELSEREVAVLRLVGRGLTNEQIAEQLVLSPRTVQSHLRRIYAKIGTANRAAATRYAAEHNLL